MGAKDLYLLQIVQYSSSDEENQPSQWAFFVHYTDKSGNPTGEGELHGIEQTQKGPKYFERSSPFITTRFRGACTLGLFYKKNVYRVLEKLEEGKLSTRKPKKSSHPNSPAEFQPEFASLPRMWLEDRLEAMRKAGVVLLGPSLEVMMRKAYQGWITHAEEMNQRGRGIHMTAPTGTARAGGSREESLDLRWGDTGSGDLIKRYYCYPFVHYATS
jgi:hypothetical protein